MACLAVGEWDALVYIILITLHVCMIKVLFFGSQTIYYCVIFWAEHVLVKTGTCSMPVLMGTGDISWPMGTAGYSSIEFCFNERR